MIAYGLHPSLWREIRKTHSGGVEVDIKTKDGKVLGRGTVSRYDSLIHLQETISFKNMSIKKLIKDTKDKFLTPQLRGSDIPICCSHFG
jgi:hypothetical protein